MLYCNEVEGKMKNYILHIPEGVKDYLREEAFVKNEIENRIKKLFTSYSYQLIETPTFEYLDVFTLGDESYQNSKLYKWTNRQGEIVALRSDMTRSIARVVATQNSRYPMPQRYAYVSNSFRYPERYQGKIHEFTQAGIELIGASNLEADAEVIRIAIEAIKEVGIEDFTIHLGSAKFLSCLLEDIGMNKTEQRDIYEAIDKKDAVKLQSLLTQAKASGELVEVIVKLIQSAGSTHLLKEVKAASLSATSLKALEELEALYKLLEIEDLTQYILFDFSILSYASYYTGMMFQGYTEGIGSAIVEGGRYDELLSSFGAPAPAVGLGINIQLLLQKLNDSKAQSLPSRTLVVCERYTREVAYKIASQFRKEGLIIEQSMSSSLDEAICYAKKASIEGILYFKNNEEVDVYHLVEDTVQTVKITSL